MATTAAKTADLILIMLDATKPDEQRQLLEHELDAVGIRLNKSKPDIVFKKRTTGGVRLAVYDLCSRQSESVGLDHVQHHGEAHEN